MPLSQNVLVSNHRSSAKKRHIVQLATLRVNAYYSASSWSAAPLGLRTRLDGNPGLTTGSASC